MRGARNVVVNVTDTTKTETVRNINFAFSSPVPVHDEAVHAVRVIFKSWRRDAGDTHTDVQVRFLGRKLTSGGKEDMRTRDVKDLHVVHTQGLVVAEYLLTKHGFTDLATIAGATLAKAAANDYADMPDTYKASHTLSEFKEARIAHILPAFTAALAR